MDRKLFLRPIFFCTVSAFLSIALFSVGIAGIAGIAGIGGLFSGGLGGFSAVCGRLVSCMASSLGFGAFRLRPLPRVIALGRLVSDETVLGRLESATLSSPLVKWSISPRTVMPFVPRYSSPMPINLTTPLSADTPSESVMKAWIRAVFRLFVTGWICEGRAVMVKM